VIAAAGGWRHRPATAAAVKNSAAPETDSVDWAAANALIDKIFEKYAK